MKGEGKGVGGMKRYRRLIEGKDKEKRGKGGKWEREKGEDNT